MPCSGTPAHRLEHGLVLVAHFLEQMPKYSLIAQMRTVLCLQATYDLANLLSPSHPSSSMFCPGSVLCPVNSFNYTQWFTSSFGHSWSGPAMAPLLFPRRQGKGEWHDDHGQVKTLVTTLTSSTVTVKPTLIPRLLDTLCKAPATVCPIGRTLSTDKQ